LGDFGLRHLVLRQSVKELSGNLAIFDVALIELCFDPLQTFQDFI
jgi:hypothetical protein